MRSVDGREVKLRTWEQLSKGDPLKQRAVEQMVIGVSTRKYNRSLERIDVEHRGTSKSAVSRRFVAMTEARLEAVRKADLSSLDLAVLMICSKRGRRRRRPIGLSHRHADAFLLRLGQVVDDVAPLVDLTPLHHGVLTKDVADGLSQGLAPVDDNERRPVHRETALLKVGEQILAGSCVLSGPLVESQDLLVPITVDAHRNEDNVFVDVDPVDLRSLVAMP